MTNPVRAKTSVKKMIAIRGVSLEAHRVPDLAGASYPPQQATRRIKARGHAANGLRLGIGRHLVLGHLGVTDRHSVIAHPAATVRHAQRDEAFLIAHHAVSAQHVLKVIVHRDASGRIARPDVKDRRSGIVHRAATVHHVPKDEAFLTAPLVVIAHLALKVNVRPFEIVHLLVIVHPGVKDHRLGIVRREATVHHVPKGEAFLTASHVVIADLALKVNVLHAVNVRCSENVRHLVIGHLVVTDRHSVVAHPEATVHRVPRGGVSVIAHHEVIVSRVLKVIAHLAVSVQRLEIARPDVRGRHLGIALNEASVHRVLRGGVSVIAHHAASVHHGQREEALGTARHALIGPKEAATDHLEARSGLGAHVPKTGVPAAEAATHETRGALPSHNLLTAAYNKRYTAQRFWNT